MDKLLPISVITSCDNRRSRISDYCTQALSQVHRLLASRNGYFDVEASCRMESALLESLFKFDINR